MMQDMIGCIVITGIHLFCVLALVIPTVVDYIRVNMGKPSMNKSRPILMTVLKIVEQLDLIIKIVIKILLRLSSGLLMLRIIWDSILGDSIPQNILSFIAKYL